MENKSRIKIGIYGIGILMMGVTVFPEPSLPSVHTSLTLLRR